MCKVIAKKIKSTLKKKRTLATDRAVARVFSPLHQLHHCKIKVVREFRTFLKIRQHLPGRKLLNTTLL